MRGVLFVAAGMLLIADGVEGQRSGMRPDTLRYLEVTTSHMTLETPQGPFSVPTDQRSFIAVVRTAGDSARAWYDSVKVSVTLPTGNVKPDLSELSGKAFSLRFGPKGHVETLATPVFPESLKGITDLSYQFVDFFPVTTARRLQPGLEWSDTLATLTKTADVGTSSIMKIVRYAVVSDSAVGGRAAFTLLGTSDIEMRSSGAVPGQPGLFVETLVRGVEHERAWVEASSGQMIGRERSADLEGDMTYKGGTQPVVMHLTQGYRSTIETVSKVR